MKATKGTEKKVWTAKEKAPARLATKEEIADNGLNGKESEGRVEVMRDGFWGKYKIVFTFLPQTKVWYRDTESKAEIKKAAAAEYEAMRNSSRRF